MKAYTIGDIHGRFEALKEVLELCSFNYEEDKLIVLGDIVDGGPKAYEVVEELLKIKNLVYVIGNHDRWFMNHIDSGWTEDIWTQQGGKATLDSYKEGVPITHQDFFNRGIYYYIEGNMVFVHGGFNPMIPLVNQKPEYLCWDRELIQYANSHKVPYNNVGKQDKINKNKYWDKVFVGHSTTLCYGVDKPVKHNNLWMVDTGAGHCGRLTIMDIDSEEFWQSEIQPSCHR